MKSLILVVALAFSVASGQDKLPEYGDLSDLKGMTKVYVTTDTSQVRGFVLDELKKYPALQVAPTSEEAEFVLKCVANAAVTVGVSGMTSHQQPFEMTAYTIKSGHNRIAWSETKTSLRFAPILLTRDFIKALKKSK